MRRRFTRFADAPVWHALIVLSLAPTVLPAQNCAPALGEAGTTAGVGSIKFYDPNGDQTSTIQGATTAWSGQCGSTAIPELKTSGTANHNVPVFFLPGNRPADPSGEDLGCGRTTTNYSGSGQFQNAYIEIWERQTDGTSCSGSYDAVMRHEIGHVLGLGHATSGSCAGSLMYNDSLNPGAMPGSQECATAGDKWFTPTEQEQAGGGGGEHPCKPAV